VPWWQPIIEFFPGVFISQTESSAMFLEFYGFRDSLEVLAEPFARFIPTSI